ncbi:hypothetical protein [Inediibacterium massiliense]|uniref:hypothetical protein n=1 Tax=Inediibacterium massiliense TaxID=1658111 RepID=UPI0006B48173|nr:hypothetical protein [Inediibacterium massiliense]
MAIVRNCIRIEGIKEDNSQDDHKNGIYYSDTNYIFIPKDSPPVKNIFEIMISLEIKSWRRVESIKDQIVVIDGIKKYKIVYAQDNEKEQVAIEEFQMPYNTYIQFIHEDLNLLEVKVIILDAYYQILNSHTLYEHIVYKVNPLYNEKLILIKEENHKNFNYKSQLSLQENCLTEIIPNSFVDVEEEYL